MKEIFIGGNTNITCPICPYFDRRKEITPFKEIEKQIKRVNEEDILIAGGDFFEYPDWPKIVDLLKDYKGRVGIQTNATHLFNEEKVKILKDVADYVEVLVPAHFDFAYTIVTNTQGVFPVFEEGLLNLKRWEIPTVLIIPINGFIVREPHNYINWVKNTLGDSIIGVKVYFNPISKNIRDRVLNHPRKDILKDAFFVKLVDAELLINLALERFGKEVAETYNIPACMVRDIEKVTLKFDVGTYFEPICDKCLLKEKICKGIPKEYREMFGHTREFYPILNDVTS